MTDLSSRTTDPEETRTLRITVTDAYHGTVDQNTIDQWELRQARIALSVLKEALRGEAMAGLLAPYIEAADQRAREIAAASRGEWGTPVESTFEVHGLQADEFFAWFDKHLADEPAMLAGNPDHYEIRMPEGVITETLGGVPTRFRFQFEPVDVPDSFQPDPAFPIRNGEGGVVATLMDGSTPVLMAAGQQLRHLDDGFVMKLSLYFPVGAPTQTLEDHARHYAIEFSRWMRMAYEASRSSS